MQTKHEDPLAWLCSTLLADAGARVLPSRIKPLKPGSRIHGRALTIVVPPGDNLAIHAALAQARPGEVLVIDGQAHTERALMGGIMCAQAAATGLAGVIIDGAIRDTAELRDGGLPVYALGASPAGPTKHGNGSVMAAIRIDHVPVNPGDWVLADDDGIVIYGEDEASGLLAAAEAKRNAEAARMAGIARGELRPSWLDKALSNASVQIQPRHA